MPEKLSCHNCKAACCRGVPLLGLDLSDKEKEFMEATGNILFTVARPAIFRQDAPYPVNFKALDFDTKTGEWILNEANPSEPLEAGMGRYALFGACKYLETDADGWEYCSVYDQRPQACQDFEMGSPKCELIRDIQGVPLPMAE